MDANVSEALTYINNRAYAITHNAKYFKIVDRHLYYQGLTYYMPAFKYAINLDNVFDIELIRTMRNMIKDNDNDPTNALTYLVIYVSQESKATLESIDDHNIETLSDLIKRLTYWLDLIEYVIIPYDEKYIDPYHGAKNMN